MFYQILKIYIHFFKTTAFIISIFICFLLQVLCRDCGEVYSFILLFFAFLAFHSFNYIFRSTCTGFPLGQRKSGKVREFIRGSGKVRENRDFLLQSHSKVREEYFVNFKRFIDKYICCLWSRELEFRKIFVKKIDY